MEKVSRHSPVAAAGAALLLGVAGAVAYAASTEPVVHGCYDARGNLRAVASAADCTRDETPLRWTEQGLQGRFGGSARHASPGAAGP